MATYTKYPMVNNKYLQITNAPGTAGTSINIADATATGMVGADCPYIATVVKSLTHNTVGEVLEIVMVTAMTSDTGASVLTVTRAQEGTTAIDLAIGDYMSLRLTSLVMNAIQTQLVGVDLQANSTKLGLIEDLADVTDATNVNAVESDPIVGAINGIVKANGSGAISAAVKDTDYQGVLAEGAFVDTDKTKLDSIETSATADQTPAEILAALLTVDGTGSGLDADLLDGLDSLAFVKADGSIDIASGTDLEFIIGRLTVGFGTGDELEISHHDMTSPNNVALHQTALGQTTLRSASGKTLYLRQGANSVLDFDIGGNATVQNDLDVVGTTKLGGMLFIDRGTDIASASPLVLDETGNYFQVTGTTNFSAISGVNVAYSAEVILEFMGILTITHGSSLQLPGDANITTAVGDVGKFVEISTGVWVCTSWQPSVTGTGSAVLKTSPTLVTPILGTPTSGTLTNTDGYPGDSSLVTTGALNSGSITSGFGSIDTGSSTITTTGKVTAPLVQSGGVTLETTATKAPALGDEGGYFVLTDGSAVAVTIPANASVAFAIGTEIHFEQGGAGAITVGITSDTLNVNANLTKVTNGQYSVCTIKKTSATTWTIFGNLVAA